MALWSIHNKPKYVSSSDVANVSATSSGWTLSKNGISEILVSIPNLTTKQIPAISTVSTDKSAYILGSDATIVFTVAYNFPITTDITSTTTLGFTIGATALTASYTSKTASTLVFTYTFPTTSAGLISLIPAGTTVSSLLVGSITLGSSKVITLDNENYVDADVISASLVTPNSIATVRSSTSTPAVPAISSITAQNATYDMGTVSTIVFTVNYNTAISTDITVATTLGINFGLLSNGLATYTSKTANSLTFTYTFLGTDAELLAGTSSTTLTFGNIVLGASKIITKADSRINVSLVVPVAPINVTISRP